MILIYDPDDLRYLQHLRAGRDHSSMSQEFIHLPRKDVLQPQIDSLGPELPSYCRKAPRELN